MPYARRTTPTTEPGEQDFHLASLRQSSDTPADLLAQGESFEDLLASGVLSDDLDSEGLETTEEFIARTEREKASQPAVEPEYLSDEEVDEMIAKTRALWPIK
ncbi:hypothetical protein [cf. Phormidesmis sp. LEGE 11477]|uniref:hypothetical protein n=1 Tax=cf. Phormidesmis sp. LEGE 11477 TaxID=1828680 RepID=UPI0018801802|nr:hypothetical protein [cf. Phormidesmis sp. LEGE 11477]MBE9062867.1 hypothetical protein [cf. Phormidesmis sp. LEGE 11477]